jgi:rhamnogalacturonan endolyase
MIAIRLHRLKARRFVSMPAALLGAGIVFSACGGSESPGGDGATGGTTSGLGGGPSSGGKGSAAGGSSGAATSGGSSGVGSSAGGNAGTTSMTVGGTGGTSGGPATGGSATAGSGALASGGVGATAGSGTTAGGAPAAGSGQGGSGGGGTSAGGAPPTGGDGFYHMEHLTRGVVAVEASGGIYVGWRMFGFEYDTTAANVAYAVYRDGAKLATVTDSTNYLDASGTPSAKYSVRAVIGGAEGADSEAVSAWGENYLTVPLQIPAGGNTPGSCDTANEAYTYSANDSSVGDLDGDGNYEIVLKWDPSNAKDNSQEGCTGNVYLDALKLDGTRLWRIDLGPNIRAGAHYTQFIVYDLDGDGKAELAVKTAPGTKDGTGAYLKLGPAAGDDDSKAYRASNGYVLTGPEYLSVFSGATGAELATVDFDQARGTVSSWGDDYGNRVDRFLATAAYLDDTGEPSFVMARGYYTRTTLTAWNFRGGKLTQLWKFDSNVTAKDAANHSYTGQGAHSLSVANVDADLGQEIVYGAMTVDHDGKGKCSTGYAHGDALHVGDFVPTHPGVEYFMVNEDGEHPSYHVTDPNDCSPVKDGPIVADQDTGRGVADDILASNPGAEMWAAGANKDLYSATTGAKVGNAPSSINFLIWWDADETRELEDGTTVSKYGGSSLLNCSQCSSNNGTKSTPTLVADVLGDWREEVIWKVSNSSALRIYTTTDVTTRRIHTLMHDPQYRVAISWQNVAYNQPPHPSFHIGDGMADPPVPNIVVK